MRYHNQNVITTKTNSYKRLLKKRGLKSITHYDTPRFHHPTVNEIKNFQTTTHIWKTGDRYYKLAHEFYNDSTKWWVIALYNKRPTEFHVNEGDVIYIPHPLDSALFYMGY
jgi:nucleoid-associated protein YgaU